VYEFISIIAVMAPDPATPKKKSVLELAKENGFDLSRVRDQREIVDAMTGKRMQDARRRLGRPAGQSKWLATRKHS
jgi:hypothetical protein